ncbi:MAG: NO-inducible flavohemoprotein [Pseudomonadota bacterium]|jgi:nitric oxide dioxygenase
MLSTSARPYIAASVPVLREHGPSITRRFYADLFAAEPGLLDLFNMGNQASGAQQGALASALFAYAANIDDAAALAPVIERIAHKHASLGIQPAQYWTVGRYLLGAIQSVLGSAATPALLSAWDEAYWLLASTLIATEARLYMGAGDRAGELCTLVVTKVERESEHVVSYCLQTPDGKSPGNFAPGQYVSVAVTLPGGRRQLRQYSLSDSPSRPSWRISVLRELAREERPAGTVSCLLHETLAVGSTLQVGTPFGNFTPALLRERPLALLAAGVGVTPMIAVLNALVDGGSKVPVLFAQAARDVAGLSFGGELERAAGGLPNLHSLTFCESVPEGAPAGITSGTMLLSDEQLAPFADADFYLCGPLAFMRAQWQSLIAHGVSPTRIHREVFGPDLLEHLLD